MTSVKHLPPPYLCAVRVFVNGELATLGSGLLVGPNLVLTALHVIVQSKILEADRDIERPLPSGFGCKDIAVQVAVGAAALARSAFQSVDLFAEDCPRDLALLKLDRSVRTVVPPTLANGRSPGGNLVFHGHRNGRFEAQETPTAGLASNGLMEDGDSPARLTLSSDLPSGYSGGPVIEVADDGGHTLWGVSSFGGTGAARLGFTAWGAIRALLSRQKCLDAFEALSRSASSPGVPAEVVLPLGLGSSLVFRPLGDGFQSLFRAKRPVSAAIADQIAGRPIRAGSQGLPAHLKEAGEVTALLAALSEASRETLRLPRLDEVTALGEASEEIAGDTGLPLRLAAYDCSLAPPGGSVEWIAGDGGQPEAWHFRRDGDARLAPGEVPVGHARFVMRPLLLGD